MNDKQRQIVEELEQLCAGACCAASEYAGWGEAEHNRLQVFPIAASEERDVYIFAVKIDKWPWDPNKDTSRNFLVRFDDRDCVLEHDRGWRVITELEEGEWGVMELLEGPLANWPEEWGDD